jgi:hypothetical protein
VTEPAARARRHERHYTLAQARALRPWVAERVRRLADARAELVALDRAVVEQGLHALESAAGGSYPGRETARPLVALSRAMAELEAVDIVVRDVERGLVDFPALRDGEEVYLCWLVDEDEIRFWHGLDAGFAGRRPL